MLPVGKTLQNGKYRIESVLGQGGFGITYRANWQMASRPVVREKVVAIKEYYPRQIVYRDSLSGHLLIPGELDAEAFEFGLKKFLREGEFLHGAKYPNVVTVHDIFEENSTAYLVMEFLEGQSLASELRANKRNPLRHERVREIADQLISALASLHDQQVYHLDIKPANVMCCENGRVVLIDFGAAKQGTNLVSQSLVTYSPAYAPPEMLGRGIYGPETDIFELGVTLYELLTGTLPSSAIERLAGGSWEPAPLPEPWNIMIHTAIELNRDKRPADIRAWWQGMGNQAQFAFPTVPITPIPAQPSNPIESDSGFVLAPTFRTNPTDGAEMVWIPGGEFIMGSDEKDRDSRANERPQRLVYLDGFWMYRYPVTVGQYRCFIQAMQNARLLNHEGKRWELPLPPPTNPDWALENHPIVNVSWYEAFAYADWVGGSLPTEAQWEKAARGTDGRTYPWGNHFEEDRVWASVDERREGTASVRRGDWINVSPFGVVDCVGNVWEWCLDWYDAEIYKTAPFRNPVVTNPRSGTRILRGGSWADSSSRIFRTPLRTWDYPDYGYVYRGFRVVCTTV